MNEKIQFVKPNIPYDKNASIAPLFRRKFSITKGIDKAEISVCGLGFGIFYINGKKITEDLFLAPVSDYRKTLWYNTYDVTNLLEEGENVIAVILGNGWYNESIETAWDFDKAAWRDIPKFALSLKVNGEEVLVSDDEFKCQPTSFITWNELRCGEYFDSRLFDPAWTTLSFDDSSWEKAKFDDTPPTGVFRECLCEPLRECEKYSAKKMYVKDENTVIYDFGTNISGYVRLRTNQAAGDKIILRHVEEIHDDLTLEYNEMNGRYYPNDEFQEDQFICCGKEFTYTPYFTYHGFRFLEVTGLKNPSINDAVAIFVHQDVKRRGYFKCSNEALNRLYEAGIISTYSNLFYSLTDCPTREKLGWLNDAQASTEQVLTNFEAERVLEKWEQDICDAMNEAGALPGIVPSHGWGFGWGSGPVSDGMLFEAPYRVYLHTGDDKSLKAAYPFFIKYLDHLKDITDENNTIEFGLNDHAGPVFEKQLGAFFLNKMLIVKFLKVKKLAEERLGLDTTETQKEIDFQIADGKKKYLNEDGTCTINEQTPVAMMIDFGIYDDLEPLKNQLAKLIEEHNFHHFCGMVGIRYLYYALNKCGLEEYAYKVLTAKGYPSYVDWLDHGATALYERWHMQESKNHHMLSDFMSWLMKTAAGINQAEDSVGFKKAEIKPYFFEDLSFVEASTETVNGKISVSWERTYNNILVKIEIPEGMEATYKGKALKVGLNVIEENA